MIRKLYLIFFKIHQPNCEYAIRLRSGEINQHIERSAPKQRLITVTDSNVSSVNIIAFRRMNQLDLSGNVVTSQEFLSSLKVGRLYGNSGYAEDRNSGYKQSG